MKLSGNSALVEKEEDGRRRKKQNGEEIPTGMALALYSGVRHPNDGLDFAPRALHLLWVFQRRALRVRKSRRRHDSEEPDRLWLVALLV